MIMHFTRAIRILSPFVIKPESLFIPIYRTITMSRCSFVDRYYTKRHEWVIIEGSTAIVGITDFAQTALGDIVYAELPEVGKELHVGDAVGAVESVKAASDIHSPISGTVMEKNMAVESNPSLINKFALSEGWLYKLKVKSANELKELMDEAAYEAFKNGEEKAAN